MWNNSSSCSNTHSCRNRWAHHPRCHGHFNDSDASFVAPKGEKSSVVEKLFIADEIIVCYSVSCRSLTMYWSVAARLHNPFLCKVKRCMCFTGPLVTISQIHSRDDRNREAVKHSHHTERQKNVFSYLPPTFKTISARSWAISWTFVDVSLLLFKDQDAKISQICADSRLWMEKYCVMTSEMCLILKTLWQRKKTFSFHSFYWIWRDLSERIIFWKRVKYKR